MVLKRRLHRIAIYLFLLLVLFFSLLLVFSLDPYKAKTLNRYINNTSFSDEWDTDLFVDSDSINDSTKTYIQPNPPVLPVEIAGSHKTEESRIFGINEVIDSEPLLFFQREKGSAVRIDNFFSSSTVRHIRSDTPENEWFVPRKPLFFCNGNIKEKKIALTIDDGWKQDYPLLDYLEKENIKCSVFVIGGRGVADKHPQWLSRMDRMGFEVCNHTYSHVNATRMTDKQFQNDIRKAQIIISKATHKFYPFLRTCGGSFSKRNLNTAARNGYILVNWSNSLMDTSRRVKSAYQIKSVLRQAKNGDIILAHFGAFHTLTVLKAVIPELKRRGFQFVTLSELLYGMY
ncbi:MAG: polysaccharide deacetylase family protein [Spirochaetales bacterium]|nr:polysaccharide deacetylase family protein [Spirochaetales bacterium]